MDYNKQVMRLEEDRSIFNSAASRKQQQIISEILVPFTQAFFEQAPITKGMHGLDLGCGAGVTTMILKSFIGSEGVMTGMDSNAFLLNIAKEKALQKEIPNISFKLQNISEWNNVQTCDFIYSGLFFNRVSNPLAVFKQVFDSLSSGGFAMVEDLDFTQFQCFPSCYAFDQFVDFYTTIKKLQGTDANIGSRLGKLFTQVGFQKVQARMIRPSFLKSSNKHIASLTLESISPLLLKENLTTTTELMALIFELRHFENQKHTMITMPGVYQVFGYRT